MLNFQGSLAETEEKYKKVVESSAKLEAEICQLKNQMETVQDTMHDIKDMRIVTHSESD